VADTAGTGGEFTVRGTATGMTDPDSRETAAHYAGYDVIDRYVLFELYVDEARCNGYGDVKLPRPRKWIAHGAR
jgi:hypothetical protein